MPSRWFLCFNQLFPSIHKYQCFDQMIFEVRSYSAYSHRTHRLSETQKCTQRYCFFHLMFVLYKFWVHKEYQGPLPQGQHSNWRSKAIDWFSMIKLDKKDVILECSQCKIQTFLMPSAFIHYYLVKLFPLVFCNPPKLIFGWF